MLEAIEKVCAGQNIKHPSKLSHLKAIQEHAPVLADVLLSCSYPLLKQFLDLIKLLISYVSAPFGNEDLGIVRLELKVSFHIFQIILKFME